MMKEKNHTKDILEILKEFTQLQNQPLIKHNDELINKAIAILEESLLPDLSEWKPTNGELALFSRDQKLWLPLYLERIKDDPNYTYKVSFSSSNVEKTYDYYKYCKPLPTHLNKQPNTGVAPDCKFVWVKFFDGYCQVACTADLNWALTPGHRKVNVIEEFAIIE